MPHAEKDTMGEPAVNGEKVHSQFLTVLPPPSLHRFVASEKVFYRAFRLYSSLWLSC